MTLDFTQAVITQDALLVEVNVRGGELLLVTRPGIVVDAASLIVRYTHLDIRADAEPGVPVVLRVLLNGKMRYGRVEVQA